MARRKRKRSRSRKVCTGKGANRRCFRKPRRLGRGRGPAASLKCGDVPKTRSNAMMFVRRLKALGKSAKMSRVKVAPVKATYVVCHN